MSLGQVKSESDRANGNVLRESVSVLVFREAVRVLLASETRERGFDIFFFSFSFSLTSLN